jgi:purine-nucleoside phosphorylase
LPEQFAYQQYEEAAEFVRARIRTAPQVGVILGSGLGSLVDLVTDPVVTDYVEIPHFPPSTVEGHAGRLVAGVLEGVRVLLMQGRTHYYEGYSMQQITLPVRVMKLLGVRALIVTNSAGGINPHYRTGDLMLFSNHINLVGIGGPSPLRGPNIDEFGPRFPDMSCPYDGQLRSVARRVATDNGIPLHEGVYAMVAGPSYESAADVHFLKVIGADAVGMSTVPEVIVARHTGMRVVGISGISNIVSEAPAPGEGVAHEEVIQAGAVLAPRLGVVIRGILASMRDKTSD